MSYIRVHNNKWQSIIRIKGHPTLAKSFKSKTDAKRWANETEIKIRREDAGIVKIKYPSFRDISLRYLNEVSIHKKCHRDERYTINTFSREAWSEYPINKITPLIVGKYRDRQREVVKDNTINRKLDVVSTIYTTCKKEWGYPVANPVLSIRRPKMPEPLTRRLSEREINLLLRGNRTSEILRTIIELALETAMRQGEILRIHPKYIEGNTSIIYLSLLYCSPLCTSCFCRFQ